MLICVHIKKNQITKEMQKKINDGNKQKLTVEYLANPVNIRVERPITLMIF